MTSMPRVSLSDEAITLQREAFKSYADGKAPHHFEISGRRRQDHLCRLPEDDKASLFWRFIKRHQHAVARAPASSKAASGKLHWLASYHKPVDSLTSTGQERLTRRLPKRPSSMR
jgi:hypothetical protein